jgi:copper oxidase (laccase) domain-containing protein
VNAMSLLGMGVPKAAIARVGPCTSCGGANLASYRREGQGAGRQLSWVARAR